ncbi:type I restriction enzyme, S subunit [Staphylococcus hominis]
MQPVLRFPEFNGEWEKKKLGNLSSQSMYGIGASAIEFDKKNVYVRITDIDEDTRKITGDYTSPDTIDEKYLLEKNDILFARTGASTGKTYIHNKFDQTLKYYFAGFLIKFKVKDNYSSKFIYQYTFTEMYKNWVKVMSVRSGQPGINSEEYSKLFLRIPNKDEQQKIGDFFSKLDQQIELEEKKLELLEQQKRGYMQKLFSQELRFKTKDNVYYSEWQLHKLGEIFKYSQGQQISVDKQFSVKSNEMKRFIRIVDITENPEPRFVLYESDTGLVNKEDLFMIRYGRPGIVSIGFEGIIANNLFKLIPKMKISTVYFYYLLSYNYYRINLLTNQSTMPALNFKSLDLLKFKIPSYKEQNKIGNFFTKFDELIEKQNKKIDGLKERKKGLLQKMFV